METDHPSSPERPATEIETGLQAVVEGFLAALQAGERPDRAHVVAQHPDLTPWLDERLKLVELVFQAAQDGDAADNGRLPRDQARRLKCPHCGNQVQLVEPRPKEVTCVNCGSSFRLEPETTATFQSSRARGEFGRFQVIELLGRGAFGEVYKARDRELDRFVALKVPRADYFANSEETQRFLREARTAAGLRHASIVQVHEIAHERGLPYIVSDYIEGLTLADLISGGRPAFRESAELVAQLADALDYAHRQKVIHRDIKPSNTLLTAPEGKHAGGSQFVPYLTDFGLARRDEGEITVTLDGQVLGTPAYMSPEQAAGDHARVDGRSDVYSLGVVLYELLSGELPFRGSRRMLLHQVLHDEPRPPRTLNERIPRDLETICLKAMAKEPTRRYPTAADFRDDLRRFLRGDPITARRVGPTERTWRWCRRNPLIASLSSMAILLLVAVATVSTLAYLRETKLVNEKDELIQDKDGLIAEKDGLITEKEELIQEKDREVTRADTANEAAQRELYAVKIARATTSLDANDYRAAEESLTSIPLKRRGWEYYQLWRRLEGTTLTLRGHANWVASVSFSPDGTRLASASYDNTVKLWDAQTGAELQTLRGHEGAFVSSVVFSPDRTRLACGAWDNTVKLWDAQTGAALQTLRGHSGAVTSVSFSPDGMRLASASFDQTVKLWDAQSGAELQTLHGHAGMVNSVSFSPDGTRLASGAMDGMVKLWDAQTGAALQTLQVNVGAPEINLVIQVNSVSFSPDGTRLASACQDNTIKLWDAQSGGELLTLRGHSSLVDSVSFSPDGMRLASASWDRTVKLWDVQTGAQLKTLRGHSGFVSSVSFSPDGMRLASASWDRTVKLWDGESGTELQPLGGHSVNVTSVSFSPDGTRLASASRDCTIKLWDVQSKVELHTLRGHTGMVNRVSFSPDGTRLASASFDQTVKLWDAQTGAELRTLRRHTAQVDSVSFSPDGTRLASASWDHTVKLWDAQSGAELKTLRGHSNWVDSVSFSRDGTRLASASFDCTAKLWDAHSGAELQTLHGHANTVHSVSFSPDGTRLASASGDGTVKLWDTQSGAELKTLRGHSDLVQSVSFSPDGTRLASASWDHTVKLWDAQSGAELQTLRGHTAQVDSVSFSPDGMRLASASQDGTVKLWDTQSEAELQILRGHRSGVASVSFSPDGTRLVSRDIEEKTLVWKLQDGELLPDEPSPDRSDLTDQSPDPLLRAIRSGTDIQLIRKDPKYDPWKEDAELRKKLSPKWHADELKKAVEAENWYAAAFHLAWLVKLNPDDPYLPRRHTRVLERLTAKGMPLPVISRDIPEVAVPEPTLSTMDLTYITSNGQMICYRFFDRSRQPVRSPAGSPWWIGWLPGERRWIALVDKQLQRLPVDDSSPAETLWTFDKVPEEVAVSPDGQRLAWQRRNDEKEDPHLIVQGFDGKPPLDLGFGGGPDWSLDGQRLTCQTRTDRWNIGVWDGTTMSIRNPPFRDFGFPAFAPDGRQIAFCGRDRGDNLQIAVMTVDGAQIRQVTKNDRINKRPAYSPDGQYIAYVRLSGPEGVEVAVVDLLTEEETVIASNAAPVRPVWRKVANSP